MQEIIRSEDVRYRADKVFENLDVSKSTRQDYQYRIGKFADFVVSRGLNRNTFLEYKRYLVERNDLSVSSKNKYLTAARILLKELNRTGYLPTDITQNIKAFSQSKKHKREGLSNEEMSLLIQKLVNLPSTYKNTRLKAILSLLALQGLRQIEVVRLNVKDLDLANLTAFVQGKGQDDKEIIYLHPETLRVLREYLKTNKIASGPLFPGNSIAGRLTTRSIRNIAQLVLKELGIEKTTHGFRHWFTTKLIETYKGDLLEVARLTRHRNLEMLQVYNDNIKRKADLPRYYRAFEGLILD